MLQVSLLQFADAYTSAGICVSLVRSHTMSIRPGPSLQYDSASRMGTHKDYKSSH